MKILDGQSRVPIAEIINGSWLCVISRKENNRAKYVATGNQREFVAGNAAIIFRVFFPILRIANRFYVYPRLPTRAGGQQWWEIQGYIWLNRYHTRIDDFYSIAWMVGTWSTVALSASGYLRRVAWHVEEEVSTRVITSPVIATEISISRPQE